MAIPDFYAVLEVTRTASPEELRAAYRRLARVHHPDANPNPEAEARMRLLNQAWETLRDPGRRTEYDRSLPLVRPPARRAPPPRRSPAPASARSENPAPWFQEDAPRSGPSASVEYTGDPAMDWYAIVGVRPDAPRQQILKALSKMAASLNGADVSATEFGRKRQQMKEAWSVLGDQYMRAAYDRARKAHAQQPAEEARPSTDPAPQAAPPGYRQGPVALNGLAVDKGASLPGVDLRGADLRGLDLAGVDLSGAQLQGADLESVSLRRAKLANADLSGANLRGADLSNADGSGLAARQADFSSASLHAANLFRANLAGASFSGAVGPAINLDFADLARTDFSGARITAQLIERGRLSGTIMPDGSVREG